MGGEGSGRKPNSLYRAQAEEEIVKAAKPAAQYLRDVSEGSIKRPSPTKVDVCKYIINQTLGAPRQKLEHAGGETPIGIRYVETVLDPGGSAVGYVGSPGVPGGLPVASPSTLGADPVPSEVTTVPPPPGTETVTA